MSSPAPAHAFSVPFRAMPPRRAPAGRSTVRLTCLALALMAQTALGAAARPATSIAWADYLGAQEQEVRWAHTMRGYGRGRTGMDRLGGMTAKTKSMGPATLPGPNVRTLVVPLGSIPRPADAEGVRAYFRYLDADHGTSWAAFVRKQAETMAAELKGRQIYWQVGNEINSRNYGNALPGNGAGRWLAAAPNDEAIIPVYAEKVLAPAVAGLAAANPRPKIIVGTLANAFRPASREWLVKLLDYTVQGSTVASLRGRKVSSLGDVVGIHYLLSQDDQDWRSELDRYYSAVVVDRHMQGLWLTEEIGAKFANRGLGGAVALKDWARFMSWVSLRGLTPDQARMNFWGWQQGPEGSRGAEAMEYLHRQIGDSSVVVMGSREFTPQPFGELFAFKVAGTGNVLLIAVGTTGTGARGAVALPAGSPAKGAECHLFGLGGNRPASCAVSAEGLRSDALVALRRDDVFVALVK